MTWTCATGTARAHPEFSPTQTNRYVKLTLLGPSELRLAYTVMYGAAPALAARQAADANHDGKLDDAESAALGRKLAAEVLRGLELTVDGKRVVPAFEEPQVGLAGAEVAPSPFSIDLIARVAAPGAGPHEVRFDDLTPLPELGETEVRIEESPAAHLWSAHRGPTGEERETRFVFRGPKFSALEDRSITFRFGASPRAPAGATAAPPAPRGAHRWIYFLVGGAALSLLLGAWLSARRKDR